MSQLTQTEMAAQQAAERAAYIAAMMAPLQERRAKLEGRQAHIENELEKLRADPKSSAAKIAELDREWMTTRREEARLNEEEGVAKSSAASLRD